MLWVTVNAGIRRIVYNYTECNAFLFHETEDEWQLLLQGDRHTGNSLTVNRSMHDL